MKRCLPLCLYVVPALAGLYLLGAAALSLCFSASAVSVAAPGGGTLQVITGGQADAALSGVVFWLVAVATPLFLLCISYVNGNHDPWRGISRAKRWGIPGAFALAASPLGRFVPGGWDKPAGPGAARAFRRRRPGRRFP